MQPPEAQVRKGARSNARSGVDSEMALSLPKKEKPPRLLQPNAVPAAAVDMAIILEMQLEDVVDIELFKREVAADVAVALGPRATNVKVTGLRAGSVIVGLEATPVGTSNAELLKHQLQEQCKDADSLLMRGKHTARTVGIIDFGSDTPGEPAVSAAAAGQ